MIRVLVVEEVRAVGEVLVRALASEPDVQVTGCAGNIDEALPLLARCDVVLVNTSLNNEASSRLIRTVRKLAPKAKIVVMGLARSQHAILQCIEAGVSGYVLKDSSLSELVTNLRAAYNNEALVSPPIAAALMSYVAELVSGDGAGEAAAGVPQSLTRREREVLSLVQQGLTNQEIAESLVIELGTVKNHVHNILRKLNVNSRRDAVHVSRLAGLWGGAEARPRAATRRPAERPSERPMYSPSLGST